MNPIENITPKDDAFHGIKKRISLEWWYFDAVFEDGHSIHIGIKLILFGKTGIVRQLVDFYKGSKLIKKSYTTHFLNKYNISKEYPDIKYKDIQILKFDYKKYKSTGIWEYVVKVDVGKLKTNLKFTGKTKGFKYISSHEGWTVAQPKAEVKGSISVDGNNIELKGSGYHDHNWNFSWTTALRGKGWYWGKVSSKNYTLTWARIMKTFLANKTTPEKISILNQINKNYISIKPKNVIFNADKNEFNQGRFIPTLFTLKIKQDEIEIDLKFDKLSVKRSPPKFFTVHYYRYLVRVNGYIKIGKNVDLLKDDLEIIEFIRFV